MDGVTKEQLLPRADMESPNTNKLSVSESVNADHDIVNETAGVGELNPCELIICPVTINNVSSSALLDSGASISLMRYDIFESICCPLIPDKRLLVGIGPNNPISCCGSVTVSLKLHEMPLQDITFVVVPSSMMRHPLILGVDCLKANSLIIDIKSNC